MKITNPNGIEFLISEEVLLEDFRKSLKICERSERRVAVFGGSGIDKDSAYYEKATIFSKNVSSSGISVITGGGHGIMEAGNKGAFESKNSDLSYGIRVKSIAREFCENVLYVKDENLYTYNTLVLRLLTLIGSSDVVVLFPGGFGTLEELFSLLVRVRVEMMKKIPIYLFGSSFWGGLVSWLKNTVLKEKTIDDQDVELFSMTDDVEKMSLDVIEYCRNLDKNV